jgi:hypothetical protein
MDTYLDKLTNLDQQLQLAIVSQQVAEIKQIIAAVKAKQVLAAAPKQLGLLPDQLADLIKVKPKQKQQIVLVNQLLNSFRQYLSIHAGIWSMANLQTARLLKKLFHVQTAIEVMAGNAYWSLALKQVGMQVSASDSLSWAKTSQTGQQPFFPVEKLTATEALRQNPKVDLILCSWAPNFGHSDLDLVKNWRQYCPQAKLFFIGEKNGVTNSPDFWRLSFYHNQAVARLNRSFTSYDFIEERFYQVRP